MCKNLQIDINTFFENEMINQVKNHIMCIIFKVYRNGNWGVYILCMLHGMMDYSMQLRV